MSVDKFSGDGLRMWQKILAISLALLLVVGGSTSIVYEKEVHELLGINKDSLETIFILIFSVLLLFQYIFKLDAALGIAIIKSEDRGARSAILLTGVLLALYALYRVIIS